MNYQQIKTIKKYSINNNLLLLGLLIFATFAQACSASTKGGITTLGGGNGIVNKTALLTTIGDFGGMDSSSFKQKVGKDAQASGKKEITVTLASEEVKTFKLAAKIQVVDEETSKTNKVSYFKGLGSKLVKGEGMLKREKLVENEAITGVFKTALGEFGKDNGDKNAKIFILVRLLELRQEITTTLSNDHIQQLIANFKSDVEKVKPAACGVLVKIDAQGGLDFVELTTEDQEKLKGRFTKGNSVKYTLSEELYKFIETKVVKPIEDAVAQK